MIRKPNEDLFKDTTMTFGEHLEELRTCLVKALLGLVGGFLIGMYFANDVVQIVKTPMEDALKDFHSKQAIAKFERELALGKELPYSIEDVFRLVTVEGLLFDIYYFHESELAGQLQLNARHASQPANEDLHPAAAESSQTTNSESAAGAARLGNATPSETSNAAAGAAPKRAISAADLKPIFLWHRIADDQRIRLIGLSAQDSFMIWIKAALVVGLVIASPWVFWQLWTFVAAGLYPHEKRYVHLFMPFSIGLFLLGASLAFLFVFKPVLEFLLSFYASMDIDPDQRITDWLSFVLLMPIAFGVSFQLPLVMLFLERIGIFTVTAYLQKWRIAILVIFIVSMVLSPGGDPYSMMMMAGPLTILYFLGIMLCKYLPKTRSPFDPA